MKKYKITVDGQSYEVEVEDMGQDASPSVNQAGTPAADKPVAAPASTATSGGHAVKAPMPGTVLSVTASIGQKVSHGDVLLILEAMKMENEIVADVDGTIGNIHVQKGSTVNAGDPLVSILR